MTTSTATETETADVIYLLIAHVRLQGKPHLRGSTSCFFCFFLFMHFYPGTITTQVESINSDLQLGLDRHLRHTQH